MAGERQRLLSRMRELRDEYMAAHRAGMAALERRDLVELGKVIERERAILDEQIVILGVLRIPPPDPAE